MRELAFPGEQAILKAITQQLQSIVEKSPHFHGLS